MHQAPPMIKCIKDWSLSSVLVFTASVHAQGLYVSSQQARSNCFESAAAAAASYNCVLICRGVFAFPFSVTPPVVISSSRTTCCPSSGLTRPRTRAIACTGRVRPQGSHLSSQSSLRQTILMSTITRWAGSSTRTPVVSGKVHLI